MRILYCPVAMRWALPAARAVRSYAHQALGAACPEAHQGAGIRCHP
jgi:hypothetical protein